MALKTGKETYTPGPWTIETRGKNSADDHACVLSVGPAQADHCHWHGWTVRMGIEDARLIAAAPELLETLKFVERMHQSEDTLEPHERLLLSRVRAAIAKATGAGQ